MNKDIIQGKWEQIKGTIIAKWGEMTEDELLEMQGDTRKLMGWLQERHGKTHEEAQKIYDDLFGVKKED